MSNQNKQTKHTVTLNGFGGMDSAICRRDATHAADIVNFRIRTDGSLEKRCGYRHLAELGGTPRAWIVGSPNGTPSGYALVYNNIKKVNLSSGTITTLGKIGTSTGPACFFFYHGDLYLTDGQELYRYANSTFTPCKGYVPLFGKDWKNNEVGEIFEPKNILNQQVRITYKIADPPSGFLCVGEPIESVEAVYHNGILLSEEEYYIDNQYQSVNVSTFPAVGDRLTVYLTLQTCLSSHKNILCQATDGLLFGDADNHRLFLWGMEDHPSTVFRSVHVSERSLEESRKHYPYSDRIYFPKDFEFIVGNGQHKLQGAVKQQDRLLFFTEGEVWMSKADASGMEEFPTVSVHPAIGCPTPKGMVLAGNDAVSVGDTTVWHWEKDANHTGGYRAISLSEPIDPTIGSEEFSHLGLFYDFHKNELWLFHPDNGDVRICHLPSGNWYRFQGVVADRFFDGKESIGFLRGESLFLFDPTLTEDHEKDGSIRPIQAIYRSGILDFGTEKRKNLCKLILFGDLDGGTVTLQISPDECAQTDCQLSAKENEPHSILIRRLHSGRFRHASLTLTAPDSPRQVIHRLELHTR
ncbi:MAG: hypothetical protein IJX94_00610 [Clostridia bacterium]|nr:hypothetical protein [Clostridia bacterium]